MEAEVILGIYLTFFGGGISALFWTRMNRLEDRLERVEQQMATREDSAEIRSEMGIMRSEMATMRSDLTHVALAVGAKPRASEG